MAAEFRQTEPGELEAVRALMRHSFHVDDEAPSLRRDLLAWKYYAPGPRWPGSRSYVLSQADQLLAHAAIWPLEMRLASGVRAGIGFCDWAAREEHRGIGLLLLKKLVGLAPFVLVIGGADITRQILPRVGFKPWAGLPLYARVLRPLRQALSRTSYNWKEPLRLARNALWSRASLAPAEDWSAAPGLPAEPTMAAAQSLPGQMFGRGFLDFLLACPAARFQVFVLRKTGVERGFAVVSQAGPQARLAEVRIDTHAQADWNAALSVMARAALHHTSASELTMLGSTPYLKSALAANGFRVRDERPLVILDSEGAMAADAVPQLGMLVDDASFLEFPEFPYVT